MIDSDANARLNAGKKYLNEGNTSLAWNEFEPVARNAVNKSLRVEGRVGCGVVYATEGNFDAAISQFKEALAIDPTYPLAKQCYDQVRQEYFQKYGFYPRI